MRFSRFTLLFLVFRKRFMLAQGCKLREKLVEVVLLACYSHLGCNWNFHVNPCARKSSKLNRVFIGRPSCADKRDSAMGYCWNNLLVWKKKVKEAKIS